MIYYTLFYSTLQYSIEFWANQQMPKQFLKFQKRFLRIMSFARLMTFDRQLFIDLNIMTVPCLYIFK